jgi:hypothetical protein
MASNVNRRRWDSLKCGRDWAAGSLVTSLLHEPARWAWMWTSLVASGSSPVGGQGRHGARRAAPF